MKKKRADKWMVGTPGWGNTGPRFYRDTRGEVGFGHSSDIFTSYTSPELATQYDSPEAAKAWADEFLAGFPYEIHKITAIS